MRLAFAIWLTACVALAVLAGACQEQFPAPLATDAGVAPDAGPLEPHPPPIVAPDQRKDTASSPVVFDWARGRVWTANGDVGSVSYVDVENRKVIREIPVGKDIRSVALSPDAAFLAAVDRAGATVALVDAETGALRRTVPLGTHPRACVWDSADPRWLYVAVEDDAAVAVVDRTLGQVATTIPVGRLPAGVAVSGVRRELYVTHRIDAVLTIVDLHARSVAEDVPLSDEPFSTAATPNGKPFGFESLAINPADRRRAWLPHELLAPTQPIAFDQTLFPAISVVDVGDPPFEVLTDPNLPTTDGRKNLFDAINLLDAAGQPEVFSQLCAVAMHPAGNVAWALACASDDLLTFDVNEGIATDEIRNLPGDHPVGLALDEKGQRLFVLSDQSHTLLTLDTAEGDLVKHTTLFGAPISTHIGADPVDPELRAGLKLFFGAGPSEAGVATTRNHWMSCGACHLDGFGSSNLRLFEARVASDPQKDAQIGHAGLVDQFSTAPTPLDPSFKPHDVLVALLDQGGVAGADPGHPSADALLAAQRIARVIARDLPVGPTWLLSPGSKPNLAWDTTFCGSCHPSEYAAWSKSVHAHAAEDPMVLYGVGVEQQAVGPQYSRLCAGCHDPVSARAGDVSLQSKRGVTCIGCHDVTREIRAGGNGDLQAQAHDWTQDHKAWALASLEKLRQPEFCGGCHQQFVPGAGLGAIGTLDEYHASPYVGSAACVTCHMPKGSSGIADHRAPGGNVFLGQQFGDATLVKAQMANLALVATLSPERVHGGVSVTVTNRGAGHGFPTGVTDIREPWVEIQAMDGSGNLLATYGGADVGTGLLPANAARLGIDIAEPDGTILYRHELNAATRVPFDVRVPAGEAQSLFVPLPASLPPGAKLDAVLNYRNVRTTYYRAATGSMTGSAPTIELARAAVP